MTMDKALHPRDDVASIGDNVDASIQRLKDYIGKHEGLITAIRNNNDNTIDNRMTITRKQKWKKPNSMAF